MHEINTPQPAPRPYVGPLNASAHWQAMRDLAERAEVGQERYGTPLTQNNGRDHLTDFYQKILDALPYLRLALNTWEALQSELAALRAFAEDAEALSEALLAKGWVTIPPQPTDPRVIQEAVDALGRLGWSEASRAASLRAPGNLTQTLDEMATILSASGYWVVGETVEGLRHWAATRGYVLWKYLDDAPMLTRKELQREAERQGYALTSPGQEIGRLEERMEDADRDEESAYSPLPPDATILEAAEFFWQQKYHTHATLPDDTRLLLETELRSARLQLHGSMLYSDHAAELARLLTDWFPTQERYIFSPEVARILDTLVADTVSSLKDGAPLDKTIRTFGRELLRQAGVLILEQAVPSHRGPRG